MLVFFWLAIISLFLTVVCTLEAALGMRRMITLDDVPPLQQENVPKVSVIIPACNEAETIEPALKSILAMDYPDLEVIAVNDRSVDRTGTVLEQMQKNIPAYRPMTSPSFLKAGWERIMPCSMVPNGPEENIFFLPMPISSWKSLPLPGPCAICLKTDWTT